MPGSPPLARLAATTTSLPPEAGAEALIGPLMAGAEQVFALLDGNRIANLPTLLEASGKLQPGAKIVAVQGAFKALTNMSPQDREATFVGAGRFIWSADDQTYDSLNALTRALHEKHSQPLGSIQAPQYWRLDSSNLSLAEQANQLAGGE